VQAAVTVPLPSPVFVKIPPWPPDPKMTEVVPFEPLPDDPDAEHP
jgi:hypothetical protein